jgi:hypothetical protein
LTMAHPLRTWVSAAAWVHRKITSLLPAIHTTKMQITCFTCS